MNCKEDWAPKNWWFWTVVLEKTLESPLDCKEIKPVNPKENQSEYSLFLNIHWKDWCWSWSSNTLATWCEKKTHWQRPWCWEGLKAGGEGDDRGWDINKCFNVLWNNTGLKQWLLIFTFNYIYLNSPNNLGLHPLEYKNISS